MTLVTALELYPVLYIVLVTVTGLAVGSFVNVVIHRLPKMMFADWREQCCDLLELENKDQESAISLCFPRSACPHCGHRIRAIENIPVLSYLILKGRCASCSERISPRYPVIECICALLAIAAAWKFGVSLNAVLAMLLSWSLVCITVIDLDHKLIPDDITLPFLWLGIIANMFGLFTDIYSSLLGAIIGYLSFWSIYILFKITTGKEGMGHGDFKLLAMLGAWLGWQQLPLIIILSSFVGAVVGITLLVFTGHKRSTPIPFGPYIATAGWIALIWGHEITRQYLLWSRPL
ncbi:MAG: A24 family peptidase [Gammaproteobacteria bacterium]|nr:A24 family peptidase [Gammaproteobacteria bacterium]